MPGPKRKRVSEEVMRRVSEALDRLAEDPAAPRTKRQVEALSGLGHDAVARAFRQDAAETSAPHRLNAKFDALLVPVGGSRRSPVADAERKQKQTVQDLRHQVRELQTQLDRYAMSLFAHHVAATAGTASDREVIPIRRDHAARDRTT